MNDTLIASRKHATIALLIVVAVTLLGIRQASSLAALRPEASREIPYLSLIGLQLLSGILAWWRGNIRIEGTKARRYLLGSASSSFPPPAISIQSNSSSI